MADRHRLEGATGPGRRGGLYQNAKRSAIHRLIWSAARIAALGFFLDFSSCPRRQIEKEIKSGDPRRTPDQQTRVGAAPPRGPLATSGSGWPHTHRASSHWLPSLAVTVTVRIDQLDGEDVVADPQQVAVLQVLPRRLHHRLVALAPVALADLLAVDEGAVRGCPDPAPRRPRCPPPAGNAVGKPWRRQAGAACKSATGPGCSTTDPRTRTAAPRRSPARCLQVSRSCSWRSSPACLFASPGRSMRPRHFHRTPVPEGHISLLIFLPQSAPNPPSRRQLWRARRILLDMMSLCRMTAVAGCAGSRRVRKRPPPGRHGPART